MTTLVPQRWRSDESGFTLIELMIAVAVVAILSAIAVPNYTAYVMRGKISEATSRLAVKQVQMEQFFQDNRTYVAGTACASDTTSSKFFDFSCTGAGAPAATTFIISAVGKDSMAGFTFTINQSGATTTGAVPSGWTAPSPNTCWVTKKGGEC
ncbi:MAG: prepilin-type N-terminal cleavage/methylation domain-containing protein [Burkholderiales bacterium]|jgi:type IV pilus assembly protein PilE|nr:prepilin-type N-terminal cleavage/methylation domain-containing protein [Burkholderiales bacterium]